MTELLPAQRPQLGQQIVRLKVAHHLGDDAHRQVVLLGVRGYYLNSLGDKGRNDRGVYDDALFVCAPHSFSAFNANTDPSSTRKGTGTGAGKGMAVLNTGQWQYKPGLHRGKYQAFRQAAEVTVTRDGDPPYEDTGWFGINIHKGGWQTTSSAGCQTLPPEQWDHFRATLNNELAHEGQKQFTYLLTQGD